MCAYLVFSEHYLFTYLLLAMVAFVFTCSTWEAEAGEFFVSSSLARQHIEALFQFFPFSPSLFPSLPLSFVIVSLYSLGWLETHKYPRLALNSVSSCSCFLGCVAIGRWHHLAFSVFCCCWCLFLKTGLCSVCVSYILLWYMYNDSVCSFLL